MRRQLADEVNDTPACVGSNVLELCNSNSLGNRGQVYFERGFIHSVRQSGCGHDGTHGCSRPCHPRPGGCPMLRASTSALTRTSMSLKTTGSIGPWA
eukprot:365123-Chlamydomonas_euryale.AAC.7